MKVYVPCYPRDRFLAGATLHSLRMFSGDAVEITLLPDRLEGDPFVALLADAYQAEIVGRHDLADPLARQCHGGWGFSKLVPFLIPSHQSFLCMDADCIAIGDFSTLARHFSHCDLITDLNRLLPTNDSHFFARNHPSLPIPPERIPLLRQRFVSGVFASRAGILGAAHLESLLALSRIEHSPLFPGDQGILNYWAIAQRPECIRWLSLHMQVYGASLEMPASVRSPQERLCEDLASVRDETDFKERVLERGLSPFVLHYAGASKPFIGVSSPQGSPLMNRFRRWSNRFLSRRSAGSARLQMLIDDMQATQALPLKKLVRKPDNLLHLNRWF